MGANATLIICSRAVLPAWPCLILNEHRYPFFLSVWDTRFDACIFTPPKMTWCGQPNPTLFQNLTNYNTSVLLRNGLGYLMVVCLVDQRCQLTACAARNVDTPGWCSRVLSPTDNSSIHTCHIPVISHAEWLAVTNRYIFSSTCSDFTMTGLLNLVYFTMQRP